MIINYPVDGGGGGAALPTLTNPGAASDLVAGKELIDENGNIVTGTLSKIAAPQGEITNASEISFGIIGNTPTIALNTALVEAKSKDVAIYQGAYLTVQAAASYFGDATASDVAAGKTFTSAAGVKVTGTGASGSTVQQATPTISVSSGGLITASATQSAGYVAAGTKTTTQQLTTQGSKTVTPGTTTQTVVASGLYTTGEITVAGSSNLIASNIKSDVNIFGVTGSYKGLIAYKNLANITVTNNSGGTRTLAYTRVLNPESSSQLIMGYATNISAGSTITIEDVVPGIFLFFAGSVSTLSGAGAGRFSFVTSTTTYMAYTLDENGGDISISFS